MLVGDEPHACKKCAASGGGRPYGRKALESDLETLELAGQMVSMAVAAGTMSGMDALRWNTQIAELERRCQGRFGAGIGRGKKRKDKDSPADVPLGYELTAADREWLNKVARGMGKKW